MKTRISTRLQQVLAIGAMGLLAGCQQEMVESEMNLKSNEEVPVVLTVRQGVDSESRIAYTPSTPENDGSIAMDVKWDGSEDEMLAYTYYDSEGVHLNYLFPVENSISDDGKSQDFAGTIIKNDGVNDQWHQLFYPLPWDSWITQDDVNKTLSIRYPMNNQEQDCTSGNETKHLAAYDIMSIINNQVESGNATIILEHHTSLLYMDFTLPENKAIKTIRLTSDQAIFGKELHFEFKVLGAVLASGTDDDKMATTMELTLVNDAADTSVKGYLMLTKCYIQEGASVSLYAEAIAEDGTVYQSETTTYSTVGYLFEPGKCKTMKRALVKKELYVKDSDVLTLKTNAGGLTSLLQSLPTTAYEGVTTLKIEGTLSNDDLKQTTNNELFNTEYSPQSSILGNWLRSSAGSITTLDLSGVNGLTVIPEMAFYGCGQSSLGNSSLRKVILPDGVTTIGNDAFNFADITEIVLPTTLEIIGNDSFRSTQISMLSLPQGLKTIGTRAFYWCSSLTQLIIPSSVTSIGNYSLPTNYGITIVFEETTYQLLDGDKFENSWDLDYVSLLLPFVADPSVASGVKTSCEYYDDYVGDTYIPKVYYNWGGSGSYEDASDTEKLNKANYTECN